MRFHKLCPPSPKPSAAAPPDATTEEAVRRLGLLAAGDRLDPGGAQPLGDVIGQLGRAGRQARCHLPAKPVLHAGTG